MKLTMFFGFVMCLTIVSCSGAREAYRNAKKENTVEAYRQYLKEYGGGQWWDREAKENLEKLVWERARKINTISAYQEFVEEFPKSIKRYNAQNLINELEQDQLEKTAWQSAEQENSSEAYKSFLKAFPAGKYCDTAKSAIETLAWEKVKNTNTSVSYFEFTEKFPLSKYFDKVGVKIIALTGTKKGVKLHTGRKVLMATSFRDEMVEVKPERGHLFLITHIRVTNIKGEIKVGKNDISIFDSKGKKYNPIYMEEYVSDKIAFVWEPLSMRESGNLLFVTSVPRINNLSLKIFGKDVGQVKVGAVSIVDLDVLEPKQKSRTAMPVQGVLKNYLSE